MKLRILLLLLLFRPASTAFGAPDAETVCFILTGLGGMPEYEENFEKWASQTAAVCSDQLSAEVLQIDGRETRRTEILSVFDQIAGYSAREAWVFLIGHGNFDGRDYKFNIKGPDLTGADLAVFLDALQGRSTYIVLAASASGVLLDKLAGPDRVVVTATRSQNERQPPLFMSFFLEGAESAGADVNKDRKVSLQEVFSFTDLKIKSWYEDQGRLQTEHPLINDSDGQGKLAPMVYIASPPEQAYRSLEAQQLLPERTNLEREVEALKLRKAEISLDEYYAKLEELLVELATLNERIRDLEGRP
jgi:hypothetical protein